MRVALCNEVVRELEFARQCALAAELGYDGLELAPFTLCDDPREVAETKVRGWRQALAAEGLTATSLHWLLVTPDGLSITSEDEAVRARTVDVMRRLVHMCAEVGGEALVHGSPKQRLLPEGSGADAARARAIECFRAIAEDAENAGVVYCIEPLAPRETNFVTSVDEAVGVVQEIDSPAVRTMIDCSAAALGERDPVPILIDRWMPEGMIRHVQVNDRNRRAPGQGEDRFAGIFAALERQGYEGAVAVEPFDYRPDGPGAAARAIGYIHGILETLKWQR